MVNPPLGAAIIGVLAVGLFLLGVKIGRLREQIRAEEQALDEIAAEVETRAAERVPITSQVYQGSLMAACGPSQCLSPTWCLAPACYGAAGRLERAEQAAAAFAELEQLPAAAPMTVPDPDVSRPPTSPDDLELEVRHMIERSELAIAALIAHNRHTELEQR
jgi:hypothetical protein